LVGERMIAGSQYYLGDHSSARRHLERVVAEYVTPHYTSPVLHFQLRPHVVARVYLAWILWLQGFPDQAMRTAEAALRKLAPLIMYSRCVWPWPRRHARSRCWSAMWPRRILT
jgi:hypothetical protein